MISDQRDTPSSSSSGMRDRVLIAAVLVAAGLLALVGIALAHLAASQGIDR